MTMTTTGYTTTTRIPAQSVDVWYRETADDDREPVAWVGRETDGLWYYAMLRAGGECESGYPSRALAVATACAVHEAQRIPVRPLDTGSHGE